MVQPVFGVTVVFLLFILCLVISYFIAIFRLGRKKNDPPSSRGAQIFFVDGVRLEKKKRQKKPGVKIPFEATILSPDQFRDKISGK